MPKKKIKITDENMLSNQVEEEQKVEEITPPVEKPMGILEEHFTLGSWKGHPNYSCRHCSWSGIEKIRAMDHYTGNHMALPKSKTIGAKIYDRFGNLITEREV